MISVADPAPNGTIALIGFAGHVSARADGADASKISKAVNE